MDGRRANVYRDGQLAGRLVGDGRVITFDYEDRFVAEHATRETGIATSLPFGRPMSSIGLPPFFANLLPEGRRLTVLRSRLKASLDDELALLLGAGSDPVGDICPVAPGTEPWESASLMDPARPEDVSFRELFERSLAGEIADSALPGVQDKISGSMVSFPVRGRSKSGYFILKLNPEDKPTLVANEAFFMEMAGDCGLEVPPTRVVRDKDGEPGLLVQRFDRAISPDGTVSRLHVEDACQLAGLYPGAKYDMAVHRLFEVVLPHVHAFEVAFLDLVRLHAFSYLIANGDLHAKNVSLLWRMQTGPAVSPAYDLLSTLPYGDQHMAISLNGRDQSWRRKDFVWLADRCGVAPALVEQTLDRLLVRAAPWFERTAEAGLSPKQTAHLTNTIRNRAMDLA